MQNSAKYHLWINVPPAIKMVHLTAKNKLILLDTSILKRHKEIGQIMGGVCYLDKAEWFPLIASIGMYSEIMRYPFDYLHLNHNGNVYQTTRNYFKDKSVRISVTKTKIFQTMRITDFGILKAVEYDKRGEQFKEAQGDLFNVCNRDRQRSNGKYRVDI